MQASFSFILLLIQSAATQENWDISKNLFNLNRSFQFYLLLAVGGGLKDTCYAYFQIESRLNKGNCRMSGLQSVSRVKAERLTVLRALCLWNMSLCAANISACWQAKYNTHKSAAAAQTDRLTVTVTATLYWTEKVIKRLVTLVDP